MNITASDDSRPIDLAARRPNPPVKIDLTAGCENCKSLSAIGRQDIAIDLPEAYSAQRPYRRQ